VKPGLRDGIRACDGAQLLEPTLAQLWGGEIFFISFFLGGEKKGEKIIAAPGDTTRLTFTRCPSTCDEEVARLHLEKIGVKLTRLTPAQAEYLGVRGWAYKSENYRLQTQG